MGRMVPEKPQRLFQRRPVHPGEEGHVGDGGLTDLVLLSSENVRLIGLRKCPFKRVLPSQAVESLLRF